MRFKIIFKMNHTYVRASKLATCELYHDFAEGGGGGTNYVGKVFKGITSSIQFYFISL